MHDLLAAAWLRRKRLEGRILAVEIVNALGEALGGEKAGGKAVSADSLMRSMGVSL